MRLLPVPILVAPCLAHAAEAVGVATSAAQMALGLVVVIGLLFLTLWLLKRVAAPRGAAAGLKILGAAPVGPREKVVLVEVGKTVLVLGVAPGRVATLHQMEASDLPPSTPAADPASVGPFQAQLRQLLERRR